MLRFLLLLCALLLPFGAQSATPIFVGGEDNSFATITTSGSPVADTTAGRFRSGWARHSLSLSTASSAADYYQTKLNGSNVQQLWFHAYNYTNGGSGTAKRLLGLISADGKERIGLDISGSSQNEMVKVNGTGTRTQINSSCGTLFPTTTLRYIDIYVNYTSSGGEVDYYVNGSLVCQVTGVDFTTDSTTGLAGLRLYIAANTSVGWSEVIVTDDDTRGFSGSTGGVFSAGTTSNDTTSQFTNGCTSLYPSVFTDGTYSYTSTNNQIQNCLTNTSLPSGTWGVYALSTAIRAIRAATGPQTMYHNFNISGTDYTSPCSSVSLGASMANYLCVTTTSPATSLRWGTTELTSYGIKSAP